MVVDLAGQPHFRFIRVVGVAVSLIVGLTISRVKSIERNIAISFLELFL